VDHQGDHPVGGPVLTRVVIVDDDLFVRSTLAGLLSAAPGIEVVATYDSGIEASAHAAGDRAHVTLVDISMPALGGPETTARLRAECPSTRVLALTSLTDPSAAAAMIAAGALGFLPKDLSVPAMVHAIEAARRGVSVLAGAGAELLGQQAPPVERPKLSDTEVAILRLVRDGADQRADRGRGLPLAVDREVPRVRPDHEARCDEPGDARHQGPRVATGRLTPLTR